jgi:hypothetical protein
MEIDAFQHYLEKKVQIMFALGTSKSGFGAGSSGGAPSHFRNICD